MCSSRLIDVLYDRKNLISAQQLFASKLQSAIQKEIKNNKNKTTKNQIITKN